MRGPGLYSFLIVLVVFLTVIFAMLWNLQKEKLRAGNPPPPAPPPPSFDSRLSFLAAMSFFCGLVAALTVVAAGIVSLCAQHGDLTGVVGETKEALRLRLSERILLYSSLVPAVAAVAFWIGARAAVRGSEGRLRGRALYRMGTALAVLTAWVALGTKSSLASLL